MSDQLTFTLQAIIDEGKNSLKSSAIKLPVRRRTMKQIEDAIQADSSNCQLSQQVRQILIDGEKQLTSSSSELPTRISIIAKIANLISRDYHQLRLIQLEQLLSDKLQSAYRESKLELSSTHRLISEGDRISHLELVINVSRDAELDRYVRSTTNGYELPFPSIRGLDINMMWERKPINIHNPILLLKLNNLNHWFSSEVKVTRKLVIDIVKSVTNFDTSIINDDYWKINIEFNKTKIDIVVTVIVK